jgi:SAM-dependent methyltransferase
MSPNYAFIIELASRYLPPPGRLLDYGCGTAEAAALAIERGYDAYAVDTYLGVGDSPENLAVAILATRLCYNASYLPHWRFQKRSPAMDLSFWALNYPAEFSGLVIGYAPGAGKKINFTDTSAFINENTARDQLRRPIWAFDRSPR